jgi:hypothetical protein
MSKNKHHFLGNTASTVAVGGNFCLYAYDTGYLLPALPSSKGTQEAIRPTPARSRSGENTVAVGGNFTLESRTGAMARSADSCTCVLVRSPV